MPFTIHQIITRGNSLLVQFELARKVDSVLFEGVFRDLVAGRLGIDTTWGLDSNGIPTNEVKYPLGERMEMVYNADIKQIALTYVVKPSVSNKEALTRTKTGTLRKAS
jgi:hypothetical protein